MGIIQSAVNQALTTVGVAARLSPDYELKQEKYKTETEAKNLSKQYNIQENMLNNLVRNTAEDDLDGIEQIGQVIEDIESNVNTGLQATRKRFQLDPTEKNYKKFIDTRSYFDMKVDNLKHDYQKMVEAADNALIRSGLEAEQATQSQAYQQNFIESVAELQNTNMRRRAGVFDRDEEAMI